MKKILITGANSYIGTSFEKYMLQWPDGYQVSTLDMVNDTWRETSFAGYDCVYHVAGLVHVRECNGNAPMYYKINRDLAIEAAQKAKAEGVRQFIFLSTMGVYGLEEGVITPSNKPDPQTNYSQSKLEAEAGIEQLRDDSFHVAIMRPPTVYGPNCKGNYQYLVLFAKYMPIFPNYRNQRSMLHIDNLSQFVKELVDNWSDGLFIPQDKEYVCTSEMVQQIGRDMGKKIRLWKILNPLVYIVKALTIKGKKAFGDLIYRPEDV